MLICLFFKFSLNLLFFLCWLYIRIAWISCLLEADTCTRLHMLFSALHVLSLGHSIWPFTHQVLNVRRWGHMVDAFIHSWFFLVRFGKLGVDTLVYLFHILEVKYTLSVPYISAGVLGKVAAWPITSYSLLKVTVEAIDRPTMIRLGNGNIFILTSSPPIYCIYYLYSTHGRYFHFIIHHAQILK